MRPPAVAVRALLSTKTRRNFITASLTWICFTWFFFFLSPGSFWKPPTDCGFFKMNALNDLATTIKAFKKIFPSVFLQFLFLAVPGSPSELTVSPFFSRSAQQNFFSYCTKQSQNLFSFSCCDIRPYVTDVVLWASFYHEDMQTTHKGKEKSPVNSLISN